MEVAAPPYSITVVEATLALPSVRIPNEGSARNH
jgi:hypothetical protein